MQSFMRFSASTISERDEASRYKVRNITTDRNEGSQPGFLGHRQSSPSSLPSGRMDKQPRFSTHNLDSGSSSLPLENLQLQPTMPACVQPNPPLPWTASPPPTQLYSQWAHTQQLSQPAYLPHGFLPPNFVRNETIKISAKTSSSLSPGQYQTIADDISDAIVACQKSFDASLQRMLDDMRRRYDRLQQNVVIEFRELKERMDASFTKFHSDPNMFCEIPPESSVNSLPTPPPSMSASPMHKSELQQSVLADCNKQQKEAIDTTLQHTCVSLEEEESKANKECKVHEAQLPTTLSSPSLIITNVHPTLVEESNFTTEPTMRDKQDFVFPSSTDSTKINFGIEDSTPYAPNSLHKRAPTEFTLKDKRIAITLVFDPGGIKFMCHDQELHCYLISIYVHFIFCINDEDVVLKGEDNVRVTCKGTRDLLDRMKCCYKYPPPIIHVWI